MASDDLLLSRAPVFDREARTCGYEVRLGPRRAAVRARGAPAGFFAGLLADVTGSRTMYVEMTQGLLAHDLLDHLPCQHTVAVLPADSDESPPLLDACRVLKGSGYRIAIDIHCLGAPAGPLAEIADVIRIDFDSLLGEDRLRAVQEYGAPSRQVLATNVRTTRTFLEGREQGFALFQGGFHGRPANMLGDRRTLARDPAWLLLRESVRDPLDADRLRELLVENGVDEREAGGILESGVPEVILGSCLHRALARLARGKPLEVLVVSLARARLCSRIGRHLGDRTGERGLFLTGSLSCLDAVLDMPLDHALADLCVDPLVARGLDGHGAAGRVLELVLAHERGEWDRVSTLAARAGLELSALLREYRGAVRWADAVAA